MFNLYIGARVVRLSSVVLFAAIVANLLCSPASAQTNMTYHHGRVMHSNTIYIVWWGGGYGFNPGLGEFSHPTGVTDNNFKERVYQFVRDMEGTEYYHLLNQYSAVDSHGNEQRIGPYTRFGGSWDDPNPLPAACQGINVSAQGCTIDRSDVETEVTNALVANNWPQGFSTIVALFTPYGVQICGVGDKCSPPLDPNCHFGSSGCQGFNGFGGYHFNVGDGLGTGNATPYIGIPSPANNLNVAGNKYFWPARDNLFHQAESADASINILSHEVFEAITDPITDAEGNFGWQYGTDGAEGEIGDLCRYQFIPEWLATGHTNEPLDEDDHEWTNSFNGHRYVLQKEWSNEDGGCLQYGKPAPSDPPAPFTPTATATTNGSPYTFGTWTNHLVHVRIHGRDPNEGFGIRELTAAVGVAGGSPSVTEEFPQPQPDADGFGVTSDEFSIGGEGKFSIAPSATNYLQRTTEGDTVEVWQDGTAPIITIDVPANDHGWSPDPVTVTGSATDDLSGVAPDSVRCKLAGQPGDGDSASVTVTGNGPTTVTCTARDIAGNSSSQDVTVRIDTTPAPVVDVLTPAPNGTNGWFNAQYQADVVANVTATKNAGGSNVASLNCTENNVSEPLFALTGIGSLNASGVLQNFLSGEYAIGCTATDESGKTGSATGLVKIDKVAPTLSGEPTTAPNGINGWYTSDVTIHWTCTDDGSGIVPGGCPADATISQEGPVLSAVGYVFDNAGNAKTTTSSQVKIDKTRPSLSVVAPSAPAGQDGWFNGQNANPVVQVSASDGVSGLQSLQCSLDGSPVTLNGGAFTVSGDGIHNIACSATDQAGNTANSPVTTVKIDKTPPTITCPGPATVEFTEANGTGGVSLVPTGVGDVLSPPVTVTSSLAGNMLPVGNTTVVFTATDRALNNRTCSVAVTVLGPRGVETDVLSDVTTLRSTITDREDGRKLDDTIRRLTNALAANFWTDQLHITSRDGDKVFNETKEAVNKIGDLIRDRHSTVSIPLLQSFIDRLVRSMRLLSQTAINEATGTPGVDAHKLDEAIRELAKGDEDAGRLNYGSAIDHYGKAWKKAQEAVGHVAFTVPGDLLDHLFHLNTEAMIPDIQGRKG